MNHVMNELELFYSLPWPLYTSFWTPGLNYRNTNHVWLPVFCRSIGIAIAGPIPIISGGHPPIAYPLTTPNTGKPRFTASDLFINNTAAAPSLTWLALPANEHLYILYNRTLQDCFWNSVIRRIHDRKIPKKVCWKITWSVTILYL